DIRDDCVGAGIRCDGVDEGNRVREPARVDVHEGQPGAFRRKALCGGTADAGPGTRDQDDLAIEAAHRRFLSGRACRQSAADGEVLPEDRRPRSVASLATAISGREHTRVPSEPQRTVYPIKPATCP